MKAIVGLGNPGPRYRYTRHNAGWQALDQLAGRWLGGRSWSEAKPEKRYHAEVVRCSVEGQPVLLAKPLTMMNDSGRAVRALVEKEHLALDDLLVIYDDLDLALGRIRVRAHGSSGGHGGIRSIQQQLREAARGKGQGAASEREGEADPPGGKAGAAAPPPFARIKVGIGRPPAGVDPIDFVLAEFVPDELPLVQPAIELAADAAACWLREGIEVAMNRFNGVAAARA